MGRRHELSLFMVSNGIEEPESVPFGHLASITSDECVEMVISWQFFQTIGPLLSQRLPLESAKAQPRGILESHSTLGFDIIFYWIIVNESIDEFQFRTNLIMH